MHNWPLTHFNKFIKISLRYITHKLLNVYKENILGLLIQIAISATDVETVVRSRRFGITNLTTHFASALHKPQTTIKPEHHLNHTTMLYQRFGLFVVVWGKRWPTLCCWCISLSFTLTCDDENPKHYSMAWIRGHLEKLNLWCMPRS